MQFGKFSKKSRAVQVHFWIDYEYVSNLGYFRPFPDRLEYVSSLVYIRHFQTDHESTTSRACEENGCVWWPCQLCSSTVRAKSVRVRPNEGRGLPRLWMEKNTNADAFVACLSGSISQTLCSFICSLAYLFAFLSTYLPTYLPT